MRTITTSTKFEFDTKEKEAVEVIACLLDSIYKDMREEDYFFTDGIFNYDRDYIASTVDFFEHLKNALEYNKGIVETSSF